MLLTFCVFAVLFLAFLQTAYPCTDCDSVNVTCVEGRCLSRCVNETSSGDCLQCWDSKFWGPRCKRNCPSTCLNSRCKLNNSRVVCTEGCVAGKKGGNCAVNCPSNCAHCERYGDKCTETCNTAGHYGDNCDKPCVGNCAGGCGRNTGICDHCTRGYRGERCTLECPNVCTKCERYGHRCIGPCSSPHYYGDMCQRSCPVHCKGGCDRRSGECDSSKSGYTGKYCNVTCPTNRTGGCCCNETCPTSCKDGCERNKDDTQLTLRIVCGIMAALLLLIWIAVALIRRKLVQIKRFPRQGAVQMEQVVPDISVQRGRIWAVKYWHLDPDFLPDDKVLPDCAVSLLPEQVRDETLTSSEPFTDRRQLPVIIEHGKPLPDVFSDTEDEVASAEVDVVSAPRLEASALYHSEASALCESEASELCESEASELCESDDRQTEQTLHSKSAGCFMLEDEEASISKEYVKIMVVNMKSTNKQ